VGGEDRLVFAPNDVGSLYGHLTNHLFVGVDQIPPPGDILSFCRNRSHWN
jgi:hypothetical protein